MTASSYIYDTSSIPLEILYQDEHIIVVNKPYGIFSVPSTEDRIKDSVTSRLQQQFPFVEAVHRLDMATSGIIVIAISKLADQKLKQQFRERDTKKAYYAVVDGLVEQDDFLIEFPLACDWLLRPRQVVDYDKGKYSLTKVEVLERDPVHQVTFVKLIPHTGRSHQLRVHLQAIGHPIIGDKFYYSYYQQRPYFRLCLHAGHLGFYHPATNEWLEFEAKPKFDQDLGLPIFVESEEE